MKRFFFKAVLLFLISFWSTLMYAQYIPASNPENLYDNLIPSTCGMNDVGTDTRDGNSGLGYGYGSPYYANFLNVTVNSCIGSMGTPGFYWESSAGTSGNSPLPWDAIDPDVTLVSPGGDAPAPNIDDIWAIAVYYSNTNGGYCMSIAQFNPGTYTFTPMSGPMLIQAFSPVGYEPHVNIDANNFGRYAVVMQLNGGIVSRTQTLMTIPSVPANPVFQADLVEPDIACLTNSAYQSKIIALNENRDQYFTYTREYLGAISGSYVSPLLPEMTQPRIAAPSSGVADEYAITVGRKYESGPDIIHDILFQINEGPISRANAGDPGFPSAINLNNVNALPCITYSYDLFGGSNVEQVTLGWFTEAIVGVYPIPNQPNTFIGLDLDPVFPYTPSTTEYMDISIGSWENNESVLALSGRYTAWAKSAAFTYQNSYPGYGERLVWKIAPTLAGSWKTGQELEEELITDSEKISLYPNPASHKLQIDFADFESGWQFEVVDHMGKTVQKGAIAHPNTQLNIESWAAGMYFLKLHNPSQKGQQLVRKFVKQ